LDSEDISATILLVGVAERGPVSQVNEEVEIVAVVFILESEVVTAYWVITI
jgi:hypothetical protein